MGCRGYSSFHVQTVGPLHPIPRVSKGPSRLPCQVRSAGPCSPAGCVRQSLWLRFLHSVIHVDLRPFRANFKWSQQGWGVTARNFQVHSLPLTPPSSTHSPSAGGSSGWAPTPRPGTTAELGQRTPSSSPSPGAPGTQRPAGFVCSHIDWHCLATRAPGAAKSARARPSPGERGAGTKAGGPGDCRVHG